MNSQSDFYPRWLHWNRPHFFPQAAKARPGPAKEKFQKVERTKHCDYLSMLNTTVLFVFALLKENSCVESGGFCRVVDVEKCRAVTEKLLCHNGVTIFLKWNICIHKRFHKIFLLYSNYRKEVLRKNTFKLIISTLKNQSKFE